MASVLIVVLVGGLPGLCGVVVCLFEAGRRWQVSRVVGLTGDTSARRRHGMSPGWWSSFGGSTGSCRVLQAGAKPGWLRHNTPVDESNREVEAGFPGAKFYMGRGIPRWVGLAYLAMAVVLLPWIFYLHFTLPLQQVAQHYRLAWVGFDVLELRACR